MRRRTLLTGLAATPALAAGAHTATATPAAAATPAYATAVLVPHQDDDVIRLSAYMIMMADRGDTPAMIQATDGSATRVGDTLNLSPARIAQLRYREQSHAWDWLTDGRGTGAIHRLGLPDGGGLGLTDTIYQRTSETLWSMPGAQKELYVATLYPEHPLARREDDHPDHIACARAAQRMAGDGVTVRYALHPKAAPGGYSYTVPPEKRWRVEGAVAAYTVIGNRSTPSSLKHVLATHGRTRVVS